MSQDRVIGPTGETFDVIGTAGPVLLEPGPHISAEAGADLLVAVDGGIFACSSRSGDIDSNLATGEGMYADDIRHLSHLKLEIGGAQPVLLSASSENAYESVINLTNPRLSTEEGDIEQMTLNIKRVRLVHEKFFEHIQTRNHGGSHASFVVKTTLAADFADIFEVRGVNNRLTRGRLLAAKKEADGVFFGYVGQDETFYQTFVRVSPSPDVEIVDDQAVLTWHVSLKPREAFSLTLEIEPIVDGVPSAAISFSDAEKNAEDEATRWHLSCSRFVGSHTGFGRVIEASIRDLNALQIEAGDISTMAAGIPWYVAPFGRDALITCYEMLLLNPEPARDSLLFLAASQATESDPDRDAEPGKILHELRRGELARSGLIPHTPYYGSVDSTPLFVALAAAYYRWTNDLEALGELLPAIENALVWMDKHGDRDGDGFIEYERRSPAGLLNQGWKDSEDSVRHADGSFARAPIALVEVQGYAYLAKNRIADVFAALGQPDRAESLRKEAAVLKEAFNEAFWMADEGMFAMALDGAKRQVGSITSNPGHCLYCGIVDSDKASLVAERLMAPDMFSGWGVRTMSNRSPAYNPMSYHNGSVWPHDNAIIAAGLKRYGHESATEKIASALIDAALLSPEHRLPELFCGFRRQPGVAYVSYPVACSPQAWAAAAPFMILQAMLGVSALAPEGALTINKPKLPSWLNRVELENIRVGSASVGLAFTSSNDATAVALTHRRGDVRVTIHQE
jgi:glycogen debranching enzyme